MKTRAQTDGVSQQSSMLFKRQNSIGFWLYRRGRIVLVRLLPAPVPAAPRHADGLRRRTGERLMAAAECGRENRQSVWTVWVEIELGLPARQTTASLDPPPNLSLRWRARA